MGGEPRFLAIGHVSRDLTERGPTVGGAALYASVTASRLGWRAGLVTRGAPSEAQGFLDSLDMVVDEPSDTTTTFDIRYCGDGRRVGLRETALPIGGAGLPEGWRDAEVALLAPVFQEAPTSLAMGLPGALLGVAPQGWLRRTAAEGVVEASDWYDAEVLERADVVSLSEMDVPGGRIPERWLEHDGIFILTQGRRGAVMRYGGRWFAIPAFPVREVDPTGAGDVFAAAFLIRYFETDNACAAGIFASCAASLKVERSGVGAIPTREQIHERMSRFPNLKVTACTSDKSQVYDSGVFNNDV